MTDQDKPIKFEDHSRKRMSERQIGESEVIDAIRRPSSERPSATDGNRNRLRLERVYSVNRVLVVIVDNEPEFYRVVTVYRKGQ